MLVPQDSSRAQVWNELAQFISEAHAFERRRNSDVPRSPQTWLSETYDSDRKTLAQAVKISKDPLAKGPTKQAITNLIRNVLTGRVDPDRLREFKNHLNDIYWPLEEAWLKIKRKPVSPQRTLESVLGIERPGAIAEDIGETVVWGTNAILDAYVQNRYQEAIDISSALVWQLRHLFETANGKRRFHIGLAIQRLHFWGGVARLSVYQTVNPDEPVEQRCEGLSPLENLAWFLGKFAHNGLFAGQVPYVNKVQLPIDFLPVYHAALIYRHTTPVSRCALKGAPKPKDNEVFKAILHLFTETALRAIDECPRSEPLPDWYMDARLILPFMILAKRWLSVACIVKTADDRFPLEAIVRSDAMYSAVWRFLDNTKGLESSKAVLSNLNKQLHVGADGLVWEDARLLVEARSPAATDRHFRQLIEHTKTDHTATKSQAYEITGQFLKYKNSQYGAAFSQILAIHTVKQLKPLNATAVAIMDVERRRLQRLKVSTPNYSDDIAAIIDLLERQSPFSQG